MRKTMIILRGIPGCGKSTLVDLFLYIDGGVSLVFSADDFFYDDDGNYNFDAGKLHIAHRICQDGVRNALINGTEVVIVDNTNTTEKEVSTYMKLAEEYDYRVISLIVENRHGGINSHNVPEETLQKMEERFSVKLR